MALTQLAAAPDVEALLGRVLTAEEAAKVEAILDKLSEQFRRHARQQFTPGTSTVRLKADGGRIYLWERPVTEVTTVVDDDGDAVDYEQVGQWLHVDVDSSTFLTVTYDHGAEIVPDLVRLTVADAARQALLIDAAAQVGAVQSTEAAGSVSQSRTYATWAQGGKAMLSPDDIATARTFRPRVPRIRVLEVPVTPVSIW
jgi:hypothetical protein